MMHVAGGITAVATVAVILTAGLSYGGFVPGYTLLHNLLTRRQALGKARRRIRRYAEEGFGKKIWQVERIDTRIIPSEHPQGWGFRFALDAKFIDYHGSQALHVAHLVAPAINVHGAAAKSVRLAVQEIEDVGSPDRCFERVLQFGEKQGWTHTSIRAYPEHLRLAFEMAAHEESERIAMEGELTQLEADWRDAEEVASIADNMFVPSVVSEFIERYRSKKSEA